MPFVGEDKAFVMRIISITGATLFPLALGLLLPIFMYVIVLEKEEKLLEMMKMNGMRMRDYWFMTFLFSLTLTIITYSLFFMFGYFVLRLSFFTETSFSLLVSPHNHILFVLWFVLLLDETKLLCILTLQVVTLFGWGLS